MLSSGSTNTYLQLVKNIKSNILPISIEVESKNPYFIYNNASKTGTINIPKEKFNIVLKSKTNDNTIEINISIPTYSEDIVPTVVNGNCSFIPAGGVIKITF